ncbi:GPP34 family phosphoprotein [Kitasatospora sp. NPDC004723]|uniref:GOLPH3/VPS74 family protein n=1 Tax=Kitasatospora sp. NPDC004723 TaxID=3154288 RepID=UPI0033A314A3
MAPLDPPASPGPPDPAGARPLPEELVLLCTDPGRGLLRVSSSAFRRVIAGAVLAELLLTGGITVEGRRITGFQPLGAHDEIGAAVLARLERTRKGRRPGLEAAVRRVPRDAVRHYRDRLVAQGAMTVERRRKLLVPYRVLLPVRSEAGQEIADRVAATLARTAAEEGAGTTGAGADERDRLLAGLLWAGRMDRRIYPGRQHAALRDTVRRTARDLPVAQAVRRVVTADRTEASGGG